ncbi:MAG: hypothetical protein HOP02_08980 [Methylococcaceae bacterium]|nr:hypothetical protein [Methylococcaceae bacterium]
MVTQTLSFTQPVIDRPQHVVSYRVLLGLYIIIPLCLLLQGGDDLFFAGALKAALPSSPNHYLIFQLLFGIPHIIASAITLSSNMEYVQFFKTKLLLMTAFIVLFFGVGSLFIPYKVLYLITATWTVYHVLKQQHGIARGVYQLPNWAFNALLGLSVSAGVMIYVGIFLKKSFDLSQAALVQNTAAGLCLGLILVTILSQWHIKTRFGKVFLWANTLLVLSSFYLAMQQYYFLAILVPRLVHDSTAFIFYVTHDYNRHQQQPVNFIYRWANCAHIPIFMVLPLLAFGAAFGLQKYGDALISNLSLYVFDIEIRKAVTLGIIGYLSLMHYYTESFTWKQGSPYRRYIGFKK